MSNTANLVLPYLAVGQAQKHVTVNESLRKLDAIIQLSVVSATTTAEPGSPGDGQVWIIPSGKSGTHWSAFANWSLAHYRDGVWVELTPREGWLAFVKDTGQLLYYTGSAWSLFPAAKILTVSATDKVLGRVSSGAGAAEEVAFTDQAQQLCDDTSFSAMRTTLGAGGLADANTWSAMQTHSAAIQMSGGNAVQFYNSSYKLQAGNGLEAHTDGGDKFRWLVGGTEAARIDAANMLPNPDNTLNLGNGSFRWKEVFSAAGAINTSDAREKSALRSLSDAERRAVRRVMAGVGMFQWLSAIAEKGPDPAKGGARLHAGVTAQAVVEAFVTEGLDPERYGLFCADAVVERVDVTETVKVRRPLKREVERDVLELIDGRLRVVKQVVSEIVTEERPVENAKGEAVLHEGKPVLAAVPVMEEVEETVVRSEERPVLDEKGEQLVRLGVRYDQLFAMALAALMPAG